MSHCTKNMAYILILGCVIMSLILVFNIGRRRSNKKSYMQSRWIDPVGHTYNGRNGNRGSQSADSMITLNDILEQLLIPQDLYATGNSVISEKMLKRCAQFTLVPMRLSGRRVNLFEESIICYYVYWVVSIDIDIRETLGDKVSSSKWLDNREKYVRKILGSIASFIISHKPLDPDSDATWTSLYRKYFNYLRNIINDDFDTGRPSPDDKIVIPANPIKTGYVPKP